MKKTFLIFCGLSLILAASCSKTPLEKQEDGTCNPVELSFYASIGDNVDTKLSYTPDGNVLKSSWNKTYDKLSLVSLDSYGNVVSSDIFTAQSSGEKVKFSGTYTNSNKASNIIIYYPAFSEGEGPYYSPSTGRYNKYSSHGPFGMDGSRTDSGRRCPCTAIQKWRSWPYGIFLLDDSGGKSFRSAGHIFQK